MLENAGIGIRQVINNALSFLSVTQEIRDHAPSPRFSRQLAAAHRVSGHPFIDDIKHLTP